MVNILHIADLHLDDAPKSQERARQSLDQILHHIEFAPEPVDAVVVAGDIWDETQNYGNKSGVGLFYRYLDKIAQQVKIVFMIKGNNAHDNPESIDLLHKFRSNVYAYERNVCLGVKFDGARSQIQELTGLPVNSIEFQKTYDLIIHGLPYPTKANILQGKGIDNQNENFIERYSELLQAHGLISSQFVAVPNITVFHGNVTGAKLSNGQVLVGQDIIIPAHVLQLTGSHYYALGHIHLPQMIQPNMYYSGSLYNKDFGEREKKSFNIVRLDGFEAKTEIIPLKTRPLVVIDAKFENGQFNFNNDIPENAEVKFRYVVTEDERSLITSEMLKAVQERFGKDTKIESKVIPNERQSRSETIMQAQTLEDEVREYALVTGEEINESVFLKIESLK